jgi:RNA polymerase sigma-70 factor, ECF subfamily
MNDGAISQCRATLIVTLRAPTMTQPADLDPSELELLLSRAAKGDSSAWRSVVGLFAPRIHGLVRAHCLDHNLAEEITQSTLCTVAAKIGAYIESGRFESWVFRIAMNRLRDEMRRRARQARSMPDDAMQAMHAAKTANPALGEDVRRGLETALARLSEGDREIIELRHLGGMSFRALSDYYEEPIGTLLARHHRALRKLKGLLEGLGIDGSDVGAVGS